MNRLLMKIKKISRKLIGKDELTSDDYIKYLKSNGVSVGNGCRFFSPKDIVIDLQNPFMISIGDNVRITKGCSILTHDYSWSVLAGKYGELLGGVGSVDIGNNVFIGVNSVVLKNTSIGDNVIIGAGSIVSGIIESNSVYAGVPARKISTLEEFYKKKKKNQKNEVINIIKRYNKKMGVMPNCMVLREYFWLFADRNDSIPLEFLRLMKNTGYYDKCIYNFYNSEKVLDVNNYN